MIKWLRSMSWWKGYRASATSGYGPASDYWYRERVAPVSSGVEVTQDTAMNYSACWAATRLLCGTGGRLPLNLYRRTANRGKAIAIGDPRNSLVAYRPNDTMIPMLWKSQGLRSQINAGNAYIEIQRGPLGDVQALQPISYNCVKIMVNELKQVWYVVKDRDEERVIHHENMLNFPAIMSEDGICGKGVITQARESIGMGMATESYGASWFGSGGVPRVVVTHPGKISDTARENFRNEWRDIYSGPRGDKVALLQEGAKAEPLNISPEDSQFLTTRQHNIEEIARWYGVPPHKIQHLLRATFSNIEHQSIEFVMDSLLPWLVIWEEELDRKLLTDDERGEMFFAFDVTEYTRGDTAARSTYWNMLVNSGIATRNEARIEEDMNPVEGGDTFLVQGAMVALDEDGKPSATQQVSTSESTDQNDTADEADDESPKIGDAVLESAAKFMLEGCLSRMMHKETTAVRRAASKPGEFLKWMDEFYAKHAEQLQEATGHVAMALKHLGYQPDEAINRIAADSQAELLALSGSATASEFQSAIDDMMARWDADRVAGVVQEVFSRKA